MVKEQTNAVRQATTGSTSGKTLKRHRHRHVR